MSPYEGDLGIVDPMENFIKFMIGLVFSIGTSIVNPVDKASFHRSLESDGCYSMVIQCKITIGRLHIP